MEIRQAEEALRHRIAQAGGALPFETFMQFALYDPVHGYYTSDRPKVGRQGDYYTCTQVGSVLGACVAEYVVWALQRLGVHAQSWALLEWGGGTGQLAQAMLQTLRTSYQEIYAHVSFVAIEKSALHRAHIKQRLAPFADNVGHITAHDTVAWQTMHTTPTIVIANELLDAFSVHRLTYIHGAWKTHVVCWDVAQQKFVIAYAPLQPGSPLATWMHTHPLTVQEGQTIEVPMQALAWISQLGKNMRQGSVVLIDYGEQAAQLYAPERYAGTLRCYAHHRLHTDYFSNIGAQDMTAHVPFTWAIEVAEHAGFSQLAYETQAQFLCRHGALSRLRDHDNKDPFSSVARANRAIRQLLLPTAIEDPFKVLSMMRFPT